MKADRNIPSVPASPATEAEVFSGRLKMLAPKAWRVMGYGAMGTSVLALMSIYFEQPELGLGFAVACFGLFTALLGTAMSFAHEGILIQFNKGLFKQYTNVWGIQFGTWEPLPKVELVKVAPCYSSYTIQDAVNPTFTIYEEAYKVSLFLENDDFALPVCVTNREKAVQTARYLAQKLRVECWDITEES